MKLLRTISIPAFCLMMAAGASAQISLTPPVAQAPAAPTKPAAKKETPKEKPKAPAAAIRQPLRINMGRRSFMSGAIPAQSSCRSSWFFQTLRRVRA